MHRILKIAALAMAVLVTAAPVSAQRRWTVTGLDVPELAAVDEMMQDIMMGYGIRGSTVAIVKDGRLVYARGFTWDQPNVEPVQPTTLFRIGSISKSITSVAIHQLIEQGALTHNTPVMSIIDLEPLWGTPTNPRLDSTTVDHLLTHTSGMYSLDNIYTVAGIVAAAHGVEPPPTKQEVISYIIARSFLFEPGTSWDYNNYGYIMLGMLAERITGLDFPEYVFENVFRPVGVSRVRMPHTLRVDLAPTETTYDGVEGDPYATIAEHAFAAGLMVMAAPDLARLYSALFDFPDASGLLEPATIDEMLSIPFPAAEELGYGRGWFNEDFFVNSGHTVGWLTNPNDHLRIHAHSGGGAGVHTLALWRSDGIVLVWFTNKDPVIPTLDFPEITSWPEHDLWESVGISLEPVGSAPVESWIPAVAHMNGVGDSAWRSDVGLLNRSSGTNQVRLRYHLENGFTDRELELAAGESRVISDIVGSFGENGFGPLQVFSSDALTATSRTYDQSPHGTFGQSLDGVTATGGLEGGESVVLMQLREDDSARSNIGIHNQWRRSARVALEFYDANGTLVTAHSREIPGQSTVQIDRPFRSLGGRSDIDSGYCVITVSSGQDIYVYATVIDNATDDPTAVPMKSGTGHSRQWIAAAAHLRGAHGSVWRTDLGLLNRSAAPAVAEITFRRDDGEHASVTVDVMAGQQLVIDDVVARLGMTGSGAIEISSDRPLMASSRTFNAAAEGTFGLFLDGVPDESAAYAGDTVWLAQLRQSDVFRTNIGISNNGDSNARVRIHLYDSTGAELGSRVRDLDPGAWLQFQEPFALIGARNNIEAGYARIEIESGQRVITYASVIDNATNDGTAITMKR